MPLKEFVQIMHSLKIYSTSDFVDAKRDGDLPEEIPDKLWEVVKAYRELQIHTNLKDNLEILWRMVRKVSLSDTQEQADDEKRGKRKMTATEFQNFMAGLKKSLDSERDTLEEEDLLEWDTSEQIKNDDDKASQSNRGAKIPKGKQ